MSPVEKFFVAKGKGCRVISAIVCRALSDAALFQLSSLMWQEEPQKTYQGTLENLRDRERKTGA
jgi:hypothetical protein